MADNSFAPPTAGGHGADGEQQSQQEAESPAMTLGYDGAAFPASAGGAWVIGGRDKKDAPKTNVVDLPLLALRDAYRDMSRSSIVSNTPLPLPSDTPLFCNILGAVLLEEDGEGEGEIGDHQEDRKSHVSQEREQLQGKAARNNDREWKTRLGSKQVCPVLTRLWSADEVLGSVEADGRPSDGDAGSKSAAVAASGQGKAGEAILHQQYPNVVGGAFAFHGRRSTAAVYDGRFRGGASFSPTASPPSAFASGSNSWSGADSQQQLLSITEVVHVKKLLPAAPRRVCQYAFRKNDIVWICKSCQADETCVLCNDCFRGSNHEGHDVYFYHAQSGGCCDCGDPDAWDSRGFCPKHGLDNRDPLQELPRGLVTAGSKVFTGIQNFLLGVARDLQKSFILTASWPPNRAATQEFSVMVHQNMLGDEELSDALGNIAKLKPSRIHEIRRSLRIGKAEEAKVVSAKSSSETDGVQMLEMAAALAQKGLLISIRTSALVDRIDRANDVVRWLHQVSTLSDGTCRLVCDMLDVPTLVRLMEADAQLPKELARALHDLYLTLMADQPFKTRIAAAYVRALPVVTSNYAKGVGTADSALYTLSVQFLNRSAVVKELVEKHYLLQILGCCLVTTLEPACDSSEASGRSMLNASHAVLRHRRYSPIVADLKCVLNIQGVPQRFLEVCFTEWVKILSIVHQMAPQVRQQRTHVEHEDRDWMCAFNMNISLTSLFECMLGWLREPVGTASIPAGFFSSRPPTAALDENQKNTTKNEVVSGATATAEATAPPLSAGMIQQPKMPSPPPPPPRVSQPFLSEGHTAGGAQAVLPKWAGSAVDAAEGREVEAVSLSPLNLFKVTFRSLAAWYQTNKGIHAPGGTKGPTSAREQQHQSPGGFASSLFPSAVAAEGNLTGMADNAGGASNAAGVPQLANDADSDANANSITPDMITPDGGVGASAAVAAAAAAAAGGDIFAGMPAPTGQESPALPIAPGTGSVGVGANVTASAGVGAGVGAGAGASAAAGGGSSAWAGGANAAMAAFLNESNIIPPLPPPPQLPHASDSNNDEGSTITPAYAGGVVGATTFGTVGTRVAATEEKRSSLPVDGANGSRAGLVWEHQILPTYPSGSLRVRPSAAGKSFHTILHRFFAAMIKEACACAEREGDLRLLTAFVGKHPEVITDVANSALMVLSFAAEIRAGMWRKNGQCMNDQVLNYAEPNFCRTFRDLDLLLLQFAGLSVGASQLVNHVLHRFQCFFWMFDEFNDAPAPPSASAAAKRNAPAALREMSSPPGAKRRSGEQSGSSPVGGESSTLLPTGIFSQPSVFHGGGGGGGGSTIEDGWQRRFRRRSMLDADQQLALAEECLMVLILLVTEMPVVPDPLEDNAKRTTSQRSPSVSDGVDEGSSGSPMLKAMDTEPLSGAQDGFAIDPPSLDGADGGGIDSKPKPGCRLARQLRRELVHGLAASPCTHSELHDTCCAMSQFEVLEPELMEEILRDIATRRESAHALEPGKFVLKPEVFAKEYDSTFFHQSLQSHQQASERRPPIKGPSPVAPPPPEAHPLFKQLRLDLLKSPTMVRVVGQVLLGCARNTSGRSRDTLLLRGLHLLTLAVHVMGPSASDADESAPSLGDTMKGKGKGKEKSLEGVESGGESVGGARIPSDLDVLCKALLEPSVLPPAIPATAEGGDDEGNTGGGGARRSLWGELDDQAIDSNAANLPVRARDGGLASPAKASQGAGGRDTKAGETDAAMAPVSVVKLLLELNAIPWTQNDRFISAGLEWLLDRLNVLSPRCREVINPPPQAATDAGGVAKADAEGKGDGEIGGGALRSGCTGSGAGAGAGTGPVSATALLEERRLAARKRAMDMMKSKATAFALQMDMMEGSSSDEDDDHSSKKKSGGNNDSTSDSTANSSEGKGTKVIGGSVSTGGDGSVDGIAAEPVKKSGHDGGDRGPNAGGAGVVVGQRGRRPRQEAPECIVCREETSGALGFVGFGRRSVVLDVRMEGEKRCPGIHLQFCGHALHYSCFDQYYATVVQGPDMQNHLALDIENGEFHCPLCKAVGNLMVPADPGYDETAGNSRADASKSQSLTGKGESPSQVWKPRGEATEAQGGSTGGLPRRRDAMDVCDDERPTTSARSRPRRGGGWLERKAALALDRARRSSAMARVHQLPDSPLTSRFRSNSNGRDSAAPRAAEPRPTGSGLLAMEGDGGGGGGSGVEKDDDDSDGDGDEDGCDQEEDASQRTPPPELQPATKNFLESVYEVEMGKVTGGASVSEETLFFASCRALAYTVTSTAAASSPLEAVCGQSAEGRGGGGRSSVLGDALRLRYLRQVAAALRGASAQAGIGDAVRRKLAASLRGESGCPRQLPKNNDGVDANANASADGSTGARGASAAGQKQPSTLETSIADILAAGMLSEGGDATDAKAPDAPAVVEGKSQGLTTMRGEVTASGGFKGGDLERPVVLTGAMEMLATALIVLPVGDAKGAMQCVGAFCLVRILQVLSAYRIEQGNARKARLLEQFKARALPGSGGGPKSAGGGVGGSWQAAQWVEGKEFILSQERGGDGRKEDSQESQEEKRKREGGRLSEDTTTQGSGVLVASAAYVEALFFGDSGGRGSGGGTATAGAASVGDSAARVSPTGGAADTFLSSSSYVLRGRSSSGGGGSGGGGNAGSLVGRGVNPTSSAGSAFLAGGRRAAAARLYGFRLDAATDSSSPAESDGKPHLSPSPVPGGGGEEKSSTCEASVRDGPGNDEGGPAKLKSGGDTSTADGGGDDGGKGGESRDDLFAKIAAPHVTAFLRTALLMIHVCMSGTEESDNRREENGGDGSVAKGGVSASRALAPGVTGADGSLLPTSDDLFQPLCQFFGFSETAEALLSEPGLIDSARRWLTCLTDSMADFEKDPGWGLLTPLERRRETIVRRLCDFPVPLKIDLVKLPRAYTELHAEVSSRHGAQIGHPAVCLVCSEVVDAHGGGVCTRHAKACGSGAGIFFLLQECAVLLIHEQKAAYFPSPYVDVYGERQRHIFRGRPLFLDERRYAVVRGLWVKNMVAHEVVQSRSTTRQVIISNYY